MTFNRYESVRTILQARSPEYRAYSEIFDPKRYSLLHFELSYCGAWINEHAFIVYWIENNYDSKIHPVNIPLFRKSSKSWIDYKEVAFNATQPEFESVKESDDIYHIFYLGVDSDIE